MCDAPEVHSVIHSTARKEHVCSECKGKIQIGETYRRIWGVWDGEQATNKACQDCQDLLRWFDPEGAFSPQLGGLHASIIDQAYEAGDEAVLLEAKRLIAAIKAKRRPAAAEGVAA